MDRIRLTIDPELPDGTVEAPLLDGADILIGAVTWDEVQGHPVAHGGPALDLYHWLLDAVEHQVAVIQG